MPVVLVACCGYVLIDEKRLFLLIQLHLEHL